MGGIWEWKQWEGVGIGDIGRGYWGNEMLDTFPSEGKFLQTLCLDCSR